jgi:cytidine deaminase
MEKKIPMIVQKAFETAIKARKNSYSPYSKFAVGAALVSADETVFSGCNVENASYGGTICAERVAIFDAVKNGHKKFSHIVIVTDAKTLTPPCGFCRQIMAEFFDGSTKVWLGNLKEIQKSYTLDELLPEKFGPANL